jgi:hypothetical protein
LLPRDFDQALSPDIRDAFNVTISFNNLSALVKSFLAYLSSPWRALAPSPNAFLPTSRPLWTDRRAQCAPLASRLRVLDAEQTP